MIFILTLITASELPAFAQAVSHVQIDGLEEISEELVRDVIHIQDGSEYSPDAVRKAVDNLRKWGAFKKIGVDSIYSADGFILRFDLEEADIIVAVDITGNYPYVENKIRKNITIHPGDVYSREKIEEQLIRIKEFYVREGYVGTEVHADEEDFPEWGGKVITFKVDRGSSLRLGSIEVTGNSVFPVGRFVSILDPYRQFSERRFSESMRKMTDLYRSHGYPRARVKIKEKKTDTDKNRVNVSIEVREGPRVDLVFRGALHVSRTKLSKVVTIMREGSFDDYEIEASVGALADLMRSRGYPEAKIDGLKTELPDGTIMVTFFIDEGASRRIKRLEFMGNEDVDDSELDKGMRNRSMAFGRSGVYLPEEAQGDNEAILEAMQKKGFLSAKVGKWDVAPTKQGYALDVAVPIEEGPQTLVGEIDFIGNSAFPVSKLLKEIKAKPGKPFDKPGLEDERQRILIFYGDNGHPYADVKQSYEIMAGGMALIRYQIDEGGEVHIGRLLFIGDVLTSQKALRNAMDIHEGDLFSFRKIMESQLSIRRLGPFASVNIETIGLEEREPVVHLKVRVEEQRPFMVDLGIGYSTYEQFTGVLSFVNVNAFGWAKTNSLKLTGGKKLSRAEIGWVDPRFLSSSVEMSTNAWLQYQQRPTYRYTQIGGAMAWFRRLRRFGFLGRYELDRDYFVEGDSVAADADSLRNNTISDVAMSVSYDSRDNFSDPKKGFYTVGGIDLYNEIQGTHSNFVKFSWQGENDETLLDRFTFFSALRFNEIVTFGHNVSVPTNELLFLGGTDTVRGFYEDSLGPVNAQGQATGGRTRWIFNEELRIRIWKALDWAFFYDMGSLTDSFSAISGSTIRKSFGIGLRYITPVGPIRADYGFKLGRRAGESVGHFHFTFGYVF